MSDVRIQYTENMVGANHPTLPDTLNRALMIEHANSGAHANITPTSIICTGSANIAGQIISTVANGTAPFVVTSSTPVANLVCTGTNLPMTGETTASAVSIALGSVTAGDRILVQYFAVATCTGTGTIYLGLTALGGATITINSFNSYFASQSFTASTSLPIGGVFIVEVTGSGSLTLGYNTTTTGTAPTISSDKWYAFFLKKQ